MQLQPPMNVGDISRIIVDWAPHEIAWESDNVGLQVGHSGDDVRSVLVCLDVTEQILHEAERRGANLVVSHHPLIFKPLRSLTEDGSVARCIRFALQHRISIYSAHTNLDFTRGGTSFALAEKLGVESPDFLRKTYRPHCKVVTYVPVGSLEAVAAAMAKAGAGRIGDYDHCSFRTAGTGTFRGNEQSRPALGKRGRIESVEEIRLEMVAEEWNTNNVTEALKQVHPYEEVAYEVYPIRNVSDRFGMGVIGTLKRPLTLSTFLGKIKQQLGTRTLRYAGNPRSTIHRVALCGGSGSELLPDAIGCGADAFVTSDVRYHAFHEAQQRIVLVDAGHHETERPVVGEMAARLRSAVQQRTRPPKIYVARTDTNPIMSF